MDSLEPKKLALLRILQIFEKHSDIDHPLTQENIAFYLERDYGIVIERKAISRNVNLLKEAGFDIESGSGGSYLVQRAFEDSELRMLIDGVLCSKYVTANHSADLINRLCGLSNKYFRSHVKNVSSVGEWSKTENQALFYNIEIIDEAIEQGKQITFDYNKYGVDKKMHITFSHAASPYQLIINNQRYYLMALSERWHNIGFYRLDRITNIKQTDDKLTPLKSVEGYELGLNFKEISTSFPYMFSDKPQMVEMIVDEGIIDQVIDWFGKDISFVELPYKKVQVRLKVSLFAMEYWALQYIKFVEIISPIELRQKIIDNINDAKTKYNLD